jgi:hypothetical protein
VRTIATDPQQGTILLPILECFALGKPGSGSIVLTIICDVMIYGRIWSSKPSSKRLSGLVPYRWHFSFEGLRKTGGHYLRFCSSIPILGDKNWSSKFTKVMRTVLDRFHSILDNVGGHQVLCHCHPGLFFREHIQSIKRIFYISFSCKPVEKLLCMMVSGSGQRYTHWQQITY